MSPSDRAVASTTTSFVDVPTVSRRTWRPAAVNRTIVDGESGGSKATAAPDGAETTDQEAVTGVPGLPSSWASPMIRAEPASRYEESTHASASGGALRAAGARAPVAKAWISLIPVRAPKLCCTVIRSFPAETAGNRTSLRLPRG
jgi:hypothetical protein